MGYSGIHSKRCWFETSLQEATLFFKDGIITEIRKGPLSPEPGIYDAGSRILMPGVIDAHVHINEPGRTEWEGFETATMAAAAGGITTVIDMPLNSSPVVTSLAALEEKRKASSNKLAVNCGFYGGLVPGNEDEVEELCDNGVSGIKAFLVHSGIDEFPNVAIEDLHRAMPLLATLDIPLLVHCELATGNQVKEFPSDAGSYDAWLRSRPDHWETDAVRLMIDLCRLYRCKTHIVHVSSAASLDLIGQAKQEGLPLTAETCPHYIFFNAETIPDFNTLYKCAPPIRDRSNNALLKLALKNGVLDFLASDHSPAPPSIKEITSGNLQKAWGGIAGLQFLLSAGWSALQEDLTVEEFIPLVTSHPARFLQMEGQRGVFETGAFADMVVWSPEESFTVDASSIFHKHKISPYVSQRLNGVVHQTFVNGQLVYDEGRIIVKTAGNGI